MTLFISKTGAGAKKVPTIADAMVAQLLYEYVTTANLVAGDIIDLGPLPSAVDPVDVTLYSDDLDSNGTPTITLSVGLLNAAKTDLNGGTNETWIVASTVAQNGGVARATTAAPYLMGAAVAERRIGIKVVAGAATGVGAGKKIAVLLDARQ